MKIGNREFKFGQGHVYVMGILNVTPDSFSDGGKFDNMDEALKHVEQMVSQGADIIDVGGESTRPGYQKISVEEETERVTSVIQEIKKRFDIPVSIDTYKAPVMEAALEAGADLANDIWGLRFDKFYAEEGKASVWSCGAMAEIVAKYQVPVCVMHNRKEPVYTDLLREVLEDLEDSVQIGEAAGISREQMILDPGIGFAKDYEQNLQLLAHLEAFQKFEMPLLLAASRKSVIGLTLDLPVDQREEGTLVTSVLAGINNWDFVRVHDVEKNVRALKMLEQIKKYQ
ncbi:MAG: dihydropteroate synthase [Lachnospiraceae bacterium]|nr:dihydropteroate synthase [Lachnospiraceae bacterium]